MPITMPDLAQWEERSAELEEAPASVAVKETPRPPKNKHGLSKDDLKAIKNLEATMRTAEGEIKQARLALEDPSVASNAAELLARHQTLGAAEKKLEALLERWEELESRR